MSNIYAAIDLGTSNSVLAYGNMANDNIRPLVLDIERKNDTGSISRNPTLPSAVYYYKNGNGEICIDIGDYAKSRCDGSRPGYCCKSVKSMMGLTDTVPLAEEIEDKSPSDVSARILNYMLAKAKKRLFQKEISDAVITVPAAFSEAQCQATLEAAQKSGIQIDNSHPVLLYEPTAVIFDYARMEKVKEVSGEVLSLADGPKNIMIFDLGGGTLDVTLHRVSYENEILNVRDIAICRYTRLGGDDFDAILAEDMLHRFEDMYAIKVPIARREEVLARLRKHAEQLKIDLSMAYEAAGNSNIELPEDYEFDVMDISLYDCFAFETTYTRSEIEGILAPLMGWCLKKSDVTRLQNIHDRESIENIVYPILDVMEKSKDAPIDYVLLNGGMSKFYLIKKRLTTFFGFEPHEICDPDLSVARGACYYHYCCHQNQVAAEGLTVEDQSSLDIRTTMKPLFNVTNILNETINLGLRGQHVSKLVPHGVELPYKSDEIRDLFKLETTTDSIGIELFLGRGDSKNLPNRKAATGTVKFKQIHPVGTPLSFKIFISPLRMIILEIWVTGYPNTKTIAEFDLNGGTGTKKVQGGITTCDKIRLNARTEMHELKTLTDRSRKKNAHNLKPQINECLTAITQAANPEDFFEPCISIANQCLQADPMLAHIYSIAANFKSAWNDQQKKKFVSLAKMHYSPYADAFRQNSDVMTKAARLIAMMDPDRTSFFTEYFHRVPNESVKLRQFIFQALLVDEQSDEKLLDFLITFFNVAELTPSICHTLIHRYGRGKEISCTASLGKLVKKLLAGIKIKNHAAIPMSLAVLIAELMRGDCDNPLREDKYLVRMVNQALSIYLEEENDRTFVCAIQNILTGIPLDEAKTRAISIAMERAK